LNATLIEWIATARINQQRGNQPHRKRRQRGPNREREKGETK
jgi:hypothetical protein